MKIIAFQLLTLLSLTSAFAQLVEYPIGSQAKFSSDKNTSARTQGVTLNLPFWDDFSYSDTVRYPNHNLWASGDSVYLNNGIGIRPPSKNVVTFDGVDSNGKPYNVNDVLAKGYADQLVSQPIRMDLVDPAFYSSTFISFFYQVKGRGESPDNGDVLLLSYLNSSSKWETMLTIENSDALVPDKFYQIVVPIADSRFFHDKFQFRLQNFARLSGPYDTWNVDYIYINSNRTIDDTSFTDRTISSSLTSMFVDYFSMPIKHFMQNPAAYLRKPSIELYNLKNGPPQPFSYSSTATIQSKKNDVVTTTTVPLDFEQDPNTVLNGLEFLNLTLNKIPAPGDFPTDADAIDIGFKFNLFTKDNIPPGPQNGDYIASQYSPIDFRVNDTIRTKYTLNSYYAYDDGTAEYGAGLNQAGSYVAFKFLYKSNVAENLAYIDIYFPEFGDNTSQSIQLQVRSDLSDTQASILYQGTVVVNRSTKNVFFRYPLSEVVPIHGDFYVGWKQLTNAATPFGLDKNTNNADKLFFNTNGFWVQNTTVIGSPMVRPGFGEGNPGPVTGVENVIDHPIYPNPTTRVCFLPAESSLISAIDIAGRKIETEVLDMGDKKSLTFLSSTSGLVIVRYSIGGRLYTEKIMVRGE